MRLTISVLIMALSLIGCATTKQTAASLNSQWIGQNVDNFVGKFGLPQGEYQLQNGDTILAWGDRGIVHMPGSATTTGSISPYGSLSATTTGYAPYDVKLACDLQITVAPGGAIKNISIIQDTWGKWETSRCAEVFN